MISGCTSGFVSSACSAAIHTAKREVARRRCKDCPGTRINCLNPAMARPCPEALGVDVFATVRSAGFPIEVFTDYDKEMNRYAFLLVE